MRPFRLRIAGFSIAAFIIALDQISKTWVLSLLQPENPLGAKAAAKVIEVTDFFNLVLVWNRGVSFGIFNGDTSVMPAILIGLAMVLVILVLRWLWRAGSVWEASAMGLIIGGAIGNVADRLQYGAVVDFLDFHWANHHWPAFNVADSAIVIGVAMILYLWRGRGKMIS